jgi:branched-chain amino acid transport system substrate-binding protein
VRGSLLARSRALGACAALAAGIAGCTATGQSAPTLNGKTLAIYVSAPASLASDSQAQDVVNAERLAFQQLRGQVTAYQLKLVVLTHNKISDNARQAIGDTGHAIAYLGEVAPGASAGSIGITNAQDLLQVSPTDTAAELTQKVATVANSPNKFYESLSANGRTFARVVPTTKVEAVALVHEMQLRKVRSVYVTDDGSEYGRTIASEVRTNATGSLTTASSAATADAVFFGGSDRAAATKVFDQAAASNPKIDLFAPSALNDDGFATGLAAAAQKNLYVSAPGLLPKQLATAGGSFLADFRSTYGHVPSSQAILGYEAMSAVLAVIHEAGSNANNRTTVTHNFFRITNRSSPLGTYSINQNGDTSLGPTTFVIERVRGSQLVAIQTG